MEFEDCFKEHYKTKTRSSLYQYLGLIYKYTKLTLYHILVLLLGIPSMLIWAIINAVLTFILVWMWGPMLRALIVCMYALAPWVYVPYTAIMTPIIDVQARIFRQCIIRAKLSGGVDTSREYTA